MGYSMFVMGFYKHRHVHIYILPESESSCQEILFKNRLDIGFLIFIHCQLTRLSTFPTNKVKVAEIIAVDDCYLDCAAIYFDQCPAAVTYPVLHVPPLTS